MASFDKNTWNAIFEITGALIALVGISCNTLGISFLLYSKVKRSFQVFFIVLMTSDMLHLIISLFQCLSAFLHYCDEGLDFTAIYPVAVFLKIIQLTIYNISAFIITCMSVERLIRLRFPFNSSLFGRKCTLTAVFAGILLNIIMMIPVFSMYKTPTINENNTLFAPTVLHWKGESLNSPRRLIYATIVLSITRLLPAVATFLANVYLITVLIKRRTRRAIQFINETRGIRISMSNRRLVSRNDSRFDDLGTTWTLVIIIAFLLLSLVPPAVVQLLANYFPDIYLNANRAEHGYYITTMDFGRFVAVLSAANDFFVYILMSRRSRVLLKYMCKEKMCRRCRRRRASSRQRSMATIEETRL